VTSGTPATTGGPAAAAANSASGNTKAADAPAKGAATDGTTTDETPTTTPAFAAMLDAAEQGGAKTKAPAQGKAASAPAANANAKTDPTAAPAPNAQPTHADAALQAAPPDKPDGSLVVTDPGKGNGNAEPAPAARERSGTSADAQGSLTVQDSSLQGAAALQPQLATQPAAAPVAAANLTATVANSAPVPLSGLAVEIAGSALNGKSRFEIRLDPAELGRIDVRIDVDRSGQVTSHLRVEKPETLSMLQQTAPQLQQALNDAGLKTGSGGLQFSLRDQSTSGQNGNNDQPSGNAQRLIISDEDATPVAAAGRSYGRMFTSNGGIDIRV
jgi:flagellar hook-length control protein FliK